MIIEIEIVHQLEFLMDTNYLVECACGWIPSPSSIGPDTLYGTLLDHFERFTGDRRIRIRGVPQVTDS